jgi:rRNA maturation endonuclease Nob1
LHDWHYEVRRLYTTPPQRTEQNFCPRCGKRTQDIHTCTPPQEKNT